MTPSNQSESTSSSVSRSRSRRGALVGVGMLAIAGAAFGLYPSSHSSLMTSTSVAAAEAIAPSTTAIPSFANLVDQLKPAVVSVFVDAEVSGASVPLAQEERGENPFGQDSPFEFFFRQFGRQGMPAQRVHAQGSGFFISADGYVVTNNHVVDHAKRVQIKTVDGKTLDAKVVGTDSKTDVALLKVSGPGGFPFVKFATSAPRVGDWVLAMGNPYGLGGTVTAGIVSASGRDIGSGPYNDFLQIDAPINKGNSGGPTFNMQGEVIGINTAIYSPSGGSVGIAFDIPADTARNVADQLMKKGSVSRGWVGIMVQPVTAEIADSLGLKEAKGALIDDVQQGGPAAKAGLKSGDVVLSVDGGEIKDSRDLARRIAQVGPGKKLTLQVRRGGADQSIAVTAAAFPDEQAKAEQSPAGRSDTKLGLTVAPASEVEGAGSQGVVIVAVDPNGAAAEKGLQQGDVILDVGGKAVSAPTDIATAVSEARKAGKHAVLLRIKSADNSRYVALPLNAQG